MVLNEVLGACEVEEIELAGGGRLGAIHSFEAIVALVKVSLGVSRR